MKPQKDDDHDAFGCALAIVDRIGDPRAKTSILLKIADKSHGIVEPSRITRLLEEVERILQLLDNTSFRLVLLAELGSCQLKNGNKTKAFALFKQAMELFEKDRSYALGSGALATMVWALADSELFEDALKVVNAAKLETVKGLLMSLIVRKYIDIGNINSALDSARGISDIEQKSQALAFIALSTIDKIADPITANLMLSKIIEI